MARLFLATMASAAHNLEQQAVSLYAPEQRKAPPWESLRRVQQQLLNRLLLRGYSLMHGTRFIDVAGFNDPG